MAVGAHASAGEGYQQSRDSNREESHRHQIDIAGNAFSLSSIPSTIDVAYSIFVVVAVMSKKISVFRKVQEAEINTDTHTAHYSNM